MAMSDNLRTLLKELNMTQKQFALTLHLDPGYFSRIVQGKTRLNARLQLLIENTFNVNGEWLRTGKGEIFRGNGTSSLKDRILIQINGLNEEQLAILEGFIQYLKQSRDKEEREEQEK